MNQQTALDQYHATRVETGTQEHLIVMLYEGAIRFANEARRAMESQDVPAKGTFINKASRIIQELSNALDHEAGPELAERLAALYEFVEYKLALAHTTNETLHIDHATRILSVLLESWRQIAAGRTREGAILWAEKAENARDHASLSLSV